MATNSPKKSQRIKPKSYSTCLLYNTGEAKIKLAGITLASCNRTVKPKGSDVENQEPGEVTAPESLQLTVSDKMSCNYCDATFEHRLEQKRHYRSDWHRYNLKQRLKGRDKVTEEQFEEISGNISSLSGSDSDSEGDTDTDQQGRPGSGIKLPGSPRRLIHTGNTSTDSESDSGNQPEDIARRLPKVYFRNGEGEVLSIYRCVLCHKKSHPSQHEDLVTIATSIPDQMYWAVFMAAGGHFAGAVFNKNQMVAHKTFHRYVVRAKRGTAQGSRDSQGNAPKSAGASLRRYNEAALTQDIQELISSWREYIQQCDRIFLRAPSFNRKIFFSGKSPPFSKNDERIRLIPFQTRRPTFNEAQRVYEMLASIECYGDESDMHDLVPMSPPQVFNPETGQLTPKDENQLSPRQRKLISKRLGTSPLALGESKASSDTEMKASVDNDDKEVSGMVERKESKSAVPGHILEEENMSSGTSTASDTELVETMATINLLELKEFACTKKPKRKKKSGRKRRNSLKCQTEPETNVMEEEKYHLKNSLYTACKVGDKDSLRNLLAILFSPHVTDTADAGRKDVADDLAKDFEKTVEVSEVDIKQSGERREVLEEIQGVNIGKEILQQEHVKDRTSESLIIVSQHSKSSNINDIINNAAYSENSASNTNLSNQVPACSNTDRIADTEVNTETNTETNTEQSGPVNSKENEKENAFSKKIDKDSTIDNENVTDSSKVMDDSVKSTDCTDMENDLEKDTEVAVVENTKSSNDMNTEKASLSLVTSKTSSVTGQWPDFSPVVTAGLLSEPFGDNSTTFLHVAAKEGHGNIVRILMETGANPAIRDKGGLTPYMVSKDKSTRNEFRRFMGKWPDKYDYEKAQIPGPLTEEMENERRKKEAEKKKANKKVKQEQQKVKRELEEKEKAEEREKQRYLNLSDREKRALAAEKRLVSQVTSQGAEKPVLSRCFQCGADMTGKVPFEYCDSKFCTSKCLQQHRKSQKKS